MSTLLQLDAEADSAEEDIFAAISPPLAIAIQTRLPSPSPPPLLTLSLSVLDPLPTEPAETAKPAKLSPRSPHLCHPKTGPLRPC